MAFTIYLEDFGAEDAYLYSHHTALEKYLDLEPHPKVSVFPIQPTTWFTKAKAYLLPSRSVCGLSSTTRQFELGHSLPVVVHTTGRNSGQMKTEN